MVSRLQRWSDLALYVPGYFYTLFVPGKVAPLSKNRLVSDRSKNFGWLKPFFVKFLKINILRFWRYKNDDDVIKTSKFLQQHAIFVTLV